MATSTRLLPGSRGPVTIGRSKLVFPGDGAAMINPISLANSTGALLTATVTGAQLGDFVLLGPPYDLQGVQATAYVSAADTVVVCLRNESGGVVDLGSGVWRFRLMR